MTHIETLVMNEIRKALENLERQGVGYIDCEQIGVIHYNIDGRNIKVQVSDTTATNIVDFTAVKTKALQGKIS